MEFPNHEPILNKEWFQLALDIINHAGCLVGADFREDDKNRFKERIFPRVWRHREEDFPAPRIHVGGAGCDAVYFRQTRKARRRGEMTVSALVSLLR